MELIMKWPTCIFILCIIIGCAQPPDISDDGCGEAIRLAKTKISEGVLPICFDNNIDYDFNPSSPERFYAQASEKLFNLEYEELHVSSDTFDVKCFNATVDSILTNLFGAEFYQAIQLKADSLRIDEEALLVQEGQPYRYVHKMPVLRNEIATLQHLDSVSKAIRETLDSDLSGRVYCEVVIDTIGNVATAKVIRGIDYKIDSACVSELLKLKNWEPGELYGKKVRVALTLPLTFSSN